MPGAKGSSEYKKFEAGKSLTRKQAILANCAVCSGFEAEDCLGVSCPLYQWPPYNKNMKNRVLHRENPYPEALIEGGKRYRAQKKA